MDRLVIEGGNKLSGTVNISGSKKMLHFQFYSQLFCFQIVLILLIFPI